MFFNYLLVSLCCLHESDQEHVDSWYSQVPLELVQNLLFHHKNLLSCVSIVRNVYEITHLYKNSTSILVFYYYF